MQSSSTSWLIRVTSNNPRDKKTKPRTEVARTNAEMIAIVGKYQRRSQRYRVRVFKEERPNG